MEKELKSKALEVNLEETRNVEITIPKEQLWLLSVSSSHYGINQRTSEFLKELNHPYQNLDFLSDEIKKIALSDFWLYASDSNAARALIEIERIISQLINKSNKPSTSDNLIQTLAHFLELVGKERKDYIKTIEQGLTTLEQLQDSEGWIVMQNASSLKKRLAFMTKNSQTEKRFFNLFIRIALFTLEQWQNNSKVEQWLKKDSRFFPEDNLIVVRKIDENFYKSINKMILEVENWDDFNQRIPLHSDIANYHRQLVDEFDSPISQFHYIIFLLRLPTMGHLKDYLIWDLNKLLSSILKEIGHDRVEDFVNQIFNLFEELQVSYKSIVLDCIATMGKEFALFFSRSLLNHFEEHVIRIGYTPPGKPYMSSDWQLKAEPNHLKSIRVWLELIETAPNRFEKLLAALVVNIKLGGILVFDTDLFQRDVSNLLNAEIESVFKPVKQLCRLFPVYFNQIGAEGELRDVSTELDTLSNRQDKLMHFLRKQIHIDSNNTHLDFLQKILNFWIQGDKTEIDYLLPADIKAEVAPNGKWVKPLRDLIESVSQELDINPNKLLDADSSKVKQAIDKIREVDELHRKKVLLFMRIHELLKDKYFADAIDIAAEMRQCGCLSNDDLKKYNEASDKKDRFTMIKLVYSCIDKLNGIVTDKKKTEGWESIYYKRHVAFGIPSMYGQYHEAKFEALGQIFKLEKTASKLMNEIVGELNLTYITANNLEKIGAILNLFYQGLKLDGISNPSFESNLIMLKYSFSSRSFSLSQYINIFQFLSDNVREIIRNNFYRRYDPILKEVTPFYFTNEENKNQKISLHKRSETFYRDMLSSSFMLQELDNFIASILSSLNSMLASYGSETLRDIMSFDIDMLVSPFSRETPSIDNRAFLGSKGYFLKRLYLKDYPTPPGFIITTELFRQQETILELSPLKKDFERIIRIQILQLEKITRKEFGNPTNPLLLSVRSGAAISMPGAMNTFLNVGMNDAITESLSQQPNMAWTAWDCYRRFLQSWGLAFGMGRSLFDNVISEHQERTGAQLKDLFEAEQMKQIAFEFKALLKKHDVPFYENIYMQLFEAIRNVLNSWKGERAQLYRKHLQIAEEWGTAVIIQQMVFGNLHLSSGTGVVFTHDASTGNPGIRLNGEYTLLSQGEDVVSGVANVLPISDHQIKEAKRSKRISLQANSPRVYQRLFQLADELINRLHFGHQEIEFTFESDNPYDLYILQIRDQDIYTPDQTTYYSTPPQKTKLLGKGIGVGGMLLNGVLVFDNDDLEYHKENSKDQKFIYVSADTTPDDLAIILECDGLITSRGGATSHAAVTAGRLGKVCVVNCSDMVVNASQKQCMFGKHQLNSGAYVSVDAITGSIYHGHHPIVSTKTE